MGEIKSTLDLVMEKTRNMTLSPEEKARQQRTDFEKRLQAALQQYSDNILTAESFKERVAQLRTEFGVADDGPVAAAVFKSIDPDEDNNRWLALIESLAPSSFDPLREILTAYREQADNLIKAAESRQTDLLAEHYGVHGSAVIPNAEKDIAYRESRASLKKDAKAKIEALSHQGENADKVAAQISAQQKRKPKS